MKVGANYSMQVCLMAITPPRGLVAAVLLLGMNLNREESSGLKKAIFYFQIEVIYLDLTCPVWMW